MNEEASKRPGGFLKELVPTTHWLFGPLRDNAGIYGQTVLAALIVPAARAADDSAYRTPPSAVADLHTAPRVPRGAPNSSPLRGSEFAITIISFFGISRSLQCRVP